MPRGVYDRSLTPEQRAAQKSGKKTSPAKKASPAAKKASFKRASAVQKTVSDAPPSTSPRVHTHELDIGTKFAIILENIATLGNTVQGLTSGKQTVIEYPVVPVVALLDSELKANIEVLSNLRREVFGLSEAEKASAETDVEDVEETQMAPVPAQPYPASPQGTVPMPPTPPAGFPAAQ